MGEEKSNIELFDRFLKDEMSGEEKENFQKNLQADPELQSRFQEYVDMVGGVRIHAFRDLKEKLRKTESASTGNHKTRSVFGYIGGIAAAVLVLAVIGFVLTNRNNKDNNTLFNEYYSPYPNIVNPVSRSGKTNENNAWVYYEQGKYEMALQGFRKQIAKVPGSVPAHFYSGICLLSLNKPGKAIEEFDIVKSAKSGSFTTPVKWYLALALVKNNQRKKAKQVLTEIESGKNEYSGRARTLLDKL